MPKPPDDTPSSSSKDHDKPKPAEAEASQAKGHPELWLARSSRKCTCSACNITIEPYEFKVIHHPRPEMVVKPKRWRTVWWRYFHIRQECLNNSPCSATMLPNLKIDCMRRAGKARESDEEFASLVSAATEALQSGLVDKDR